ncbi:uncharacterized protein UV8b_06020 [Ustilaginoidea virens]|uniref:Pyridoxamine 5'-phosphate oxidase-like enzyme n=1 Tax=Ustilaginoidea virens TaxID=1159556 RepID=A0A063BRC4_USTVR|nr:uncharacterized protein UV8b_06020 [Ustilaginoidea virens]QUC21777.1 hypothetical protein UV8b_06020 [Ustilaginoidea virens]GAO17436.1 hypothetical protein UVI_02052230 [Ustilaginoidea virens]FAA01165.1 TPA: pyridoxamine 5'-phosphate oxidase-like enzyme [Ustilaginoidea virens]
MPIFYDSLSDHLRDWALCQSLFFVASAPLRGRHINVSPKGLLDSSFAVLGPNQVAYVDLTGSGCETISHIRDNGRVTIMFCSFDKTPRIMRFFGTGSVFEWHEAGFAALCGKMKGVGASLAGSRAIIVVDFFKVQVSCGFGVPKIMQSSGQDDKAHFENRPTLQEFAQRTVDRGEMPDYQKKWNARSLDGLPGLRSAWRDSGRHVWSAQYQNWVSRHRHQLEDLKTLAILTLVLVLIGKVWQGPSI